jgi:DNA-directed RNA polymerase subunit RPC12/RpoP
MAEKRFMSLLEQLCHTLKCSECSEVFDQNYRSLLEADVITCPKCWKPMDLRESKRTGEIGSWFNTIAKLDKQFTPEK